MVATAVESRIESVRLHRTGAIVRRVGSLLLTTRCPRAASEREDRFVDLPLSLDDASVRLPANGAVMLSDVGVAIDAAENVATDKTPDERDIDRLKAREAELRATLQSIDAVHGMVGATSILRRPDGAEG